MVQWSTFTAGAQVLFPGWGTKIPHVLHSVTKKKKENKDTENKLLVARRENGGKG